MAESAFLLSILHFWALNCLIASAAALLDYVLPEKYRFFAVLSHPVVWMGKMITSTERILNLPPYQKGKGFISLGFWLSICGFTSVLFLIALTYLPFWLACLAQIWIAAWLLAQRSLIDHVQAVADALSHTAPDTALSQGRQAVANIVGRDPSQLDQAAICRASLESLAENGSDGVMAPFFWLCLAGLPGIICYKMINTADSMVGYLSDQYRDYGYAAAKLDDWVNMVPARLTGLSFCCATACHYGISQGRYALRIMIRDARLHKSPNAGWPESAMAASLGLALAGPRIYHFGKTEDPFMHHEGRSEADFQDIKAGIILFRTICWLWIGTSTLMGGLLLLR